MIRALLDTFWGDLRAGSSWRDIHADLWATWYAVKHTKRGKK